jgi:hypothetical protein
MRHTDRPTLYLSGPMRGYLDFNYPRFHAATRNLRDRGYRVINPAETAGGDQTLPRETYMRIDIGYVLASDAVAVLPGWQFSAGARLEVAIAQNIGLPVFKYDVRTDDLGEQIEVKLAVAEVVNV